MDAFDINDVFPAGKDAVFVHAEETNPWDYIGDAVRVLAKKMANDTDYAEVMRMEWFYASELEDAMEDIANAVYSKRVEAL
jgi:hypothetical protein